MKIIKKLKALFFKEGETVSLDLKAAEIKEGRAYLHPKNAGDITYRIKSDDIEIRLSKGKSLTDDDIYVITESKNTIPKDAKSKGTTGKEKAPKAPAQTAANSGSSPIGVALDVTDRYKKRVFTVALYPEEYDRLMHTITSFGYNRAEFIMASAYTATKGTMAKAQKKIKISHTKMRKEPRELKQKKQAQTA